MTTAGQLPLKSSTQADLTIHQQMVARSAVPLWSIDLTAICDFYQNQPAGAAQQLQFANMPAKTARMVSIPIANHAALKLLGAPTLAALNTALGDPSYAWLNRHLYRISVAIAAREKALTLVEEMSVEGLTPVTMLLHYSLPEADTGRQIVTACAFDMTSLQGQQEEFSAQQQFLAGVVDAMPDLLFVFDMDTLDVKFVNCDIATRLGYQFELAELDSDELAAFWADLVHPDDRVQLHRLDLLRQELTDNSFTERELRFKDAAGAWRYFYARSANLKLDGKNSSRYAVVAARDISTERAAQGRLQQQERHYRLLADNISDVICTCDLEMNLTYVSPSVTAAIGLSVEEFLVLSKDSNLRTEVHDFIAGLGKDIETIKLGDLEQTKNYRRVAEIDIQHIDGRKLQFELQCSLLHENDAPQGILILARDLSERKKYDADLRLAAKVFENNADGIFILDPQGYIVQLNKALCRICAYEECDLLSRKPEGLLMPESECHNARQQKLEQASNHGYWHGEQLAMRSNGDVFYAFATTTAVRDHNSDILAYICTLRDITESKSNEERIRHLAFYDVLTGLPNRTLFQDRLAQELQHCARSKHSAALLFLDLDQFKSINDSLGHAAGDQLLREVAGRLGEHVRSEDTIARMGGDEFTIILTGQPSKQHVIAAASNVARKIAAQLGEPFFIEGQEIFTSASIGIALYPDDGDSTSTLLRSGDTAMYFAKQSGKSNFQFYTPNMHAQSAQQLAFQNSLHRAAVDEEFELAYQPQFSFETNEIAGVECLLRWRKSDGTVMEPPQFLQLAEQSGLIVRIGEWAIRRACTQMVEWLDTGFALERVSINISARQFAEGSLPAVLESALNSSGLPGHHLELELTENILMSDLKFSLQTLEKLKALGIRVAVDNFGSGLSALHALRQLPLDTLKIDKRFTQDLPGNLDNQKILSVIVALAQTFELDLVAEGVESDEQSAYLAGLGCQAAQGFLFGRPQLAYDIERSIRHTGSHNRSGL